MAKTFLFMFFISGSFASIASPLDGLIAQLEKGETALCSKGNLSKFKFSIRSFNGKQCKSRFIASLAEMICPIKNIESYDLSNCHKNAVDVLKGQSPSDVFLDEIKTNASKYEALFCPYIASVCNAIKTAKSYIKG